MDIQNVHMKRRGREQAFISAQCWPVSFYHLFQGAAGVTVSTAPTHGAGPGSIPRAALQDIKVGPITVSAAKDLVMRHHYLHSFPGGTSLAFGTFLDSRLLGVVTLGVGPYNARSLVEGALASDCLTLTRLWLSDELPQNSESRILGIVLRNLRKHTLIKFVLSYADPSKGHTGTIYKATGWIYTGLSKPTPLYDLGDGKLAHCRTLATKFGTRSVRHLTNHGAEVTLVPQSPKHRYVYFLDRAWEQRLTVSVLPYPKKENLDASS